MITDFNDDSNVSRNSISSLKSENVINADGFEIAINDLKSLRYFSGINFSVKDGIIEGIHPFRIAPK